LPVFVQRDSPGSAVGGGIPIRRSSVEIISSYLTFYYAIVDFEMASCYSSHSKKISD